MASLKQLFEQNGKQPIKVKARNYESFVILSEHGDKELLVQYESGKKCIVLADCETCQDYEIVKEKRKN